MRFCLVMALCIVLFSIIRNSANANGENLRFLLSAKTFDDKMAVILGNRGDDIGLGVALDSAANIYVVGATFGSFTGFTNAGDYDCFIAKFNSSGVLQWLKQIGANKFDACFGLTIDASGNVYAVGFTEGTFSGETSSGASDAFLVKYNSSGVQQWLTQFGTSANDVANGVVVDGSNRPMIVGFTAGSFPTFTNAGKMDVFLARYTTAGARSWLKQIGTNGDDESLAIGIDSSNRIYVTGYTSGAFSGFTNAGGLDVFVTRYSGAGVQSWLKQFGTVGDDMGIGMGVAVASGISNIVGVTQGAFAGFSNAGGDDVFIARYSLAGAQSWLKQFGSAGDETALAASTDSSGNTYLCGATTGAFAGQTSAGGTDVYIAKYDGSGAQSWLKQIGSSSSGDDACAGILADSAGNSFITGYTSDAFSGSANVGGTDVFYGKYNSAGAQQWVKQIGTQ